MKTSAYCTGRIRWGNAKECALQQLLREKRSVHWKWAGVGGLWSSVFRCPSSPQGAPVITRSAYHQTVDQSVNGGRKVGPRGRLGRRLVITQWYVLPPPATRLYRSLICWKHRPDQHQKGWRAFTPIGWPLPWRKMSTVCNQKCSDRLAVRLEDEQGKRAVCIPSVGHFRGDFVRRHANGAHRYRGGLPSFWVPQRRWGTGRL